MNGFFLGPSIKASKLRLLPNSCRSVEPIRLCTRHESHSSVRPDRRAFSSQILNILGSVVARLAVQRAAVVISWLLTIMPWSFAATAVHDILQVWVFVCTSRSMSYTEGTSKLIWKAGMYQNLPSVYPSSSQIRLLARIMALC